MRPTFHRLVTPILWVDAFLVACSGVAQVPPGLSPPEYERPPASRWPPAADAGGGSGSSDGRPEKAVGVEADAVSGARGD